MDKLMHIGLGIVFTLLSLVLSFYGFRLWNKFFKGGVFSSSFMTLTLAALFYAAAHATNVVLDLTAIKSPQPEIGYYLLNLSFIAVLAYFAHQLYKAWTKLGPR